MTCDAQGPGNVSPSDTQETTGQTSTRLTPKGDGLLIETSLLRVTDIGRDDLVERQVILRTLLLLGSPFPALPLPRSHPTLVFPLSTLLVLEHLRILVGLDGEFPTDGVFDVEDRLVDRVEVERALTPAGSTGLFGCRRRGEHRRGGSSRVYRRRRRCDCRREDRSGGDSSRH